MHAVLTIDQVALAARQAADDVAGGLALATRVGSALPQPGAGQTWMRWAMLAAAAEGDLTAARILEAHSDALAIMAEAGEPAAEGTWGVFAAEAPGQQLAAQDHGDRAILVGTKPWCSLGGVLDHALITAHAGDERRLYAVDLQQDSVTADPPSHWVSRGLAAVPSVPVHFDHTPARAIGAPGWYLRRPGFAWGGIGVAACWYGGARGLYNSLVSASVTRDGELSDLHVGTVAVALHAAEASLRQAAELVDSAAATGPDGAVLALRVRSIVAAAAETTLIQVGHALGPAPLAFDEPHARRVADLEIYIRQHHAERDLAAIGAAVREGGAG
jgi:hypothetical protein